MSNDDVTARLEALAREFVAAAERGDHDEVERLSAQMRLEDQRRAAAGPRVAHSLVTLYEDNAGGLFIAADDRPVAWVVTEAAAWAPGTFEADAVALLEGDTEEWLLGDVPVVPIEEMDVPETRAIAQYDERVGSVRVARGDGPDPWTGEGRPLAGAAGRAYLGLHEEWW